MTRVSAVIPTYNYGQYVVAAVESALAQTGVEMEVVVVDDGSTDDTGQRLQAYANRIRYIRQANSGLSAARNAGIREATGEWIALLDSDDIWHPDKTRVQLSAALRVMPAAGCIGSPNCQSVASLALPLDECPAVTRLDVASLLLKAKFGTSGALVRRECFQEIGGFDVALGPAADRDMWMRLGVRYDVARVMSPCWFYRPHAGQMSHDAEKMYRDYRRTLDKFFDDNPGLRQHRASAYAFLYMDAALCYRESGDRFRALAFALRSLCKYPRPFRDEIARFLRLRFIAATILGRGVGRPDVHSPADAKNGVD